jgi:hypothetical protein
MLFNFLATGLNSRAENSMTSDSRRSGNTASQATLLGPPSVLIVRLVGDVFPLETTKAIIERNPALGVVSEFVVPENAAFIPPVGQKFFDPNYIEAQKTLHSKGKVNLSLIRDRDGELRSITETIADSIFKAVLNTTAVKEYCRNTLSGVNEFALDVPGSSHGQTALPGNAGRGDKDALASNVSYGVYFREILPRAPLLQRLVVELKHRGVLASALPVFDNAAVSSPGEEVQAYSPGMLEEEVPLDVIEEITQMPDAPVMMQWATAGDAVLAGGAEEVCFALHDMVQVLSVLGVWSGSADKRMQDALDTIMQW